MSFVAQHPFAPPKVRQTILFVKLVIFDGKNTNTLIRQNFQLLFYKLKALKKT